jgi:thymidylate kinase
MWIAKAVNWLMPQPDIWFLIDGPTDLLQSRKQEVSPQETERQRHAYKRLLDGRKNTHVLNASAPVEELVAEITTIIAKNLNERPRI